MITWLDLARAVARLRPELPALVGNDWPAFEARLNALLPQLTTEREPLARAQILDLFAFYPAAHERLLDVLVGLEPVGKGVERAMLPEGYERPAAQPVPAAVTRYSDITAPSRLALGRRGVITVGLTCAPTSDSATAAALRLVTGSLEVHLQVSPADFAVTGAAVKPLEVLPDRDSEPVVFYVTAQSAGVKTLRLDFRQAGMVVGSVPLTIDVSASPVVEAPAQEVPASVTLSVATVKPADLDLRVTVTPRDGGIALGYTLHSPNNAAPYWYQRFSDVFLPGYAPAQAYQSRLRDTLETLQAGRDGGAALTAAQVEVRLAALGNEMWESLLPEDLRRALLQSWRRVQTLQITSDEPLIPWEMLHPYDASNPEQIVDEYLGEHFRLTRWLAGDGGGAGEIVVRRLACIEAGAVPGFKSLPHAPAERQLLLDLAQRHGASATNPSPPTVAAVEALLDDGGFGLWHFVGHGSNDPAAPNEAPLVLPDGQLRPRDIFGARLDRIHRAQPLVFLSACRVGAGGWAFAGLGGWADRWVGKARCGAFVAPQWAVDDALAEAFARRFYTEVEAGQTLGEAAWLARRAVRALRPDDPTWLAYSVYAHPNARVVWG